MRGSPPLRFLAIVLGGWVALRTALIAPPWPAPPAGAAAAAVSPSRAGIALHRPPETWPSRSEPAKAKERALPAAAILPPSNPAQRRLRPSHLSQPARRAATIETPDVEAATVAAWHRGRPGFASLERLEPARASARRWSLSAWSFARRGDVAPLAAGGSLGGSQAGARLTYRLDRDSARPLALSARLSSPLRSSAGAEAVLGLDWKPNARLPVHLLAERRQALGREGRSAFQVTVFGGIGDARLGRFRLDAYAQAGLVGTRSRDPFGDGSIRLSLPLDKKLRLGAGAWAAAQPGVSRLDLGPQAALRLPLAGHSATLAADWRLRVAGNAAPGSGPTLTLSTDF